MIYADKVGSELILWDGEGKKYSYDFKDSQFYSYNIGKKRRIVKSINRFLTHGMEQVTERIPQAVRLA